MLEEVGASGQLGCGRVLLTPTLGADRSESYNILERLQMEALPQYTGSTICRAAILLGKQWRHGLDSPVIAAQGASRGAFDLARAAEYHPGYAQAPCPGVVRQQCGQIGGAILDDEELVRIHKCHPAMEGPVFLQKIQKILRKN